MKPIPAKDIVWGILILACAIGIVTVLWLVVTY
jgi:hypothetical protein